MRLPGGWSYTWPGWRLMLLSFVLVIPVLVFIVVQLVVEWLHWNISNRAMMALDRLDDRLCQFYDREIKRSEAPDV